MKAGKRLAILILAAVLIALYYAAGLDEYVRLSFLKSSIDSLRALSRAHLISAAAVYMAVYIAVTALSLPGAAVLTLGGGALFGLFTGTVIVSFASAIGATAACFFARFVFRDLVRSRFGDKLEKIERGIGREGSLYLFTLRLIPIFPFFIINLAMGLTRMPLHTFYWVSQLGMLPGTIVYVNAGKELADIESVSDVLSPGLIFSFILLGLFPIGMKKIIEIIRRSQKKDPGL